MRTRSPKTRAVTIPASRWVAYAGAAAATVLTGATSADGEIHYSGRGDVTFGPGSNYTIYFQLDQPGDSIAFRHGTGGGTGSAYFKAVGLQSGAFLGTYSGFEFAFVYRLERHARYISDGPFTSLRRDRREFGVSV